MHESNISRGIIKVPYNKELTILTQALKTHFKICKRSGHRKRFLFPNILDDDVFICILHKEKTIWLDLKIFFPFRIKRRIFLKQIYEIQKKRSQFC